MTLTAGLRRTGSRQVRLHPLDDGRPGTPVPARSGKLVAYQDLPAEDYTKALVGAGLPEPVAAMLADNDLAVARGELFTDSGHPSTLIGRPTHPSPTVTAALAG